MSEVKLAIGLDINGQRLMLDEDTARSLYFKLKELFDKGYQGPFFTWTNFPHYDATYTIPSYYGSPTSSGDYTLSSTASTNRGNIIFCTNGVEDKVFEGDMTIKGNLRVTGEIGSLAQL